MVAPAAGAIVLVRFPFSDLSQTKLRPAVVLADAGRNDYILCQITSKAYGDISAIDLDDGAFASGSLRVLSYARPAKLFTANQHRIAKNPDHPKRVVFRHSLLQRNVAEHPHLLQIFTPHPPPPLSCSSFYPTFARKWSFSTTC